jgi:hypothetical protein
MRITPNMQTFRINANAGGFLELSHAEPGYFNVEPSVDGIHVTMRSDAYMAESGSPEFFRDLAAHWRGWDGKKTWGLLEGDLVVEFSHDRIGHVRTVVKMRPPMPDAWSVAATLTVDPVALEKLAVDADRFFRNS